MVAFVFFELWLLIIAALLIAGFATKRLVFFGIAGAFMLPFAAVLEAEGVTLPSEQSVHITQIDANNNDVNYFFEARTIGNDGFINWLRLAFWPVGIIMLLAATGEIVGQMITTAQLSLRRRKSE